MRRLNEQSLAMVSGGSVFGNVPNTIVAPIFIGVGAILTNLGVLAFTPPLRGGDRLVSWTEREVVGAEVRGNQVTRYVADKQYGYSVNRPRLNVNGAFGNCLLWYGIGMLAGGIMACFGKIESMFK